MFKMQSLLILQNHAQGFHSVDRFRNEILYSSFDAPLLMTKSTDIQKKMLKVGGQDCEIKAAFWFGCNGGQATLRCRT